MHAVQALYQYRKSISTKPFNARGNKVVRCEQCRVSVSHCICHLVPTADSNVGFLLLMYDTEVLKPSNTGRLIADIFKDTYAFLWSRTNPEPSLVKLLESEQWQPFIVFPQEYVNEGRVVYINNLPELSSVASTQTGSSIVKRPLFVLLDGSWREARKMFRKSPYLDKYPVVSFNPSNQQTAEHGQYIRDSVKENQLATAEVAAKMLAIARENDNAKLLATWFDVFNYQYQLSVCQTNKGDENALSRLALLKSSRENER